MNSMIKNNKGVSLLELLISIAVGSLLIIMLMQILMLSLAAKNQLAQDTKLSNESYLISEKITLSIFQLEAQELELISDNGDVLIIEIRHLYDFTIDPTTFAIVPDYTNPKTDTITLTRSTGIMTYTYDDGTVLQLNDPSVNILDVSTVNLISIDPATCDLAVGACSQGIIELTLTLEIILPNGHPLEPQTFITRILV